MPWALERTGTDPAELLEPRAREAIGGLLRANLERSMAADAIERARWAAHDAIADLLRQIAEAPPGACEASAETIEQLERVRVVIGLGVQPHPVRGESAWIQSARGIADDHMIAEVLWPAEAKRATSQDDPETSWDKLTNRVRNRSR